MCREFHDFSHEVSPNMMKIDRDHPPEPPHVENLPHAMGELVQLSARSYDSSSPPQPAEKKHDWNVGWAGKDDQCCKRSTGSLVAGFYSHAHDTSLPDPSRAKLGDQFSLERFGRLVSMTVKHPDRDTQWRCRQWWMRREATEQGDRWSEEPTFGRVWRARQPPSRLGPAGGRQYKRYLERLQDQCNSKIFG